MATYRLTVREGPRVERTKHETLEEAMEALRVRTGELRAEGGLDGVSMLRDFEPGQLVKARLEISTGSFLRKREAGVDLMGDGRVVPYIGGIGRTVLEVGETGSYEEAIASALRQ